MAAMIRTTTITTTIATIAPTLILDFFFLLDLTLRATRSKTSLVSMMLALLGGMPRLKTEGWRLERVELRTRSDVMKYAKS